MPASVNDYPNASELKRHPADFYRTDPRVAYKTLEFLAARYTIYPKVVLDPGAGEGIWGEQAVEFTKKIGFQRPALTGVELREIERPSFYTNKDLWWAPVDFIEWASRQPEESFNLVCGNPPFNGVNFRPPLWEQFFHASWKLVEPVGAVVFMLPIKVICGLTRAKGLWQDYPPARFMPLCPRPGHYINSRSTNKNDYGIAIWVKSREGEPIGHPGRFMCEPLVWLETKPHETKHKTKRSKK